MDHSREITICRICLASLDATYRSWSLFNICIDQKTPAEVILFCFGIKLSGNKQSDKMCEHCKSDLEAAYRFLKYVRLSDNTFSSFVPKSEIGIPHKRTEAYFTDEDIKIEEILKYEELQSSNSDHEKQICRPQSANDTIQANQKLHSDIMSLRTRSPVTSEDDQNNDSDYARNSTSDEDDDNDADRTKHASKRLYYGVKFNSQPKRCCSCKEPLDSLEKVQKHSETYHLFSRITNPKEFGDKLFECPVCFKRFNTKILFLQHQRKMYVEVLHPCPKCEEEFANLFVLKKHIKCVHKKKFIVTQLEEMRSKVNICCGCKESFSSKRALKEHVERTHYSERMLSETTNTFECEVCYHRFKTNKSLKHHQLRFFKEKKFVCTLCGKCFREKVRLTEHENLHRKIATFQCAYCPAKFAIKNSYEVHVKMHDAEECYNCEYCGKGFRKKSLLMGHLQIHDTDRPFKCNLCPITFTRQNLLDAHLLAHSGSKPHKCKQCTASYIHQRDLRRHIREKHEGIRSFKCNLCPKAYIRQKLLDTHLRTHEK